MLETLLNSAKPWGPAALCILLGALGGWLLSRLGRLIRSKGWLSLSSNFIDDVAFDAFFPYLKAIGFLTGLLGASAAAPLSGSLRSLLIKGGATALATTILLALARTSVLFLERLSKANGFQAGELSLSRAALRGLVLGLGGLLILSNLGVSVAPLLTALGVGSLAVALALQDTLGNLFAGIQLALAKPVRVGDYIELDNGQQGYVRDLGWRATRLEELPGNMVIVPNLRLTQMLVKNYHLPAKDLAVLVQVRVAYGSDLEKVEKTCIEVGTSVQKSVKGGLRDFVPFIRYHTLAESSINFSVILRGEEFVDRYLITHEFIKALQHRFKEDGIEIPFPQRVLHWQRPGNGTAQQRGGF